MWPILMKPLCNGENMLPQFFSNCCANTNIHPKSHTMTVLIYHDCLQLEVASKNSQLICQMIKNLGKLFDYQCDRVLGV